MELDRYTRITLRLPRELHAKLEAQADKTSKSLNAEIVMRLEQSFGDGSSYWAISTGPQSTLRQQMQTRDNMLALQEALLVDRFERHQQQVKKLTTQEALKAHADRFHEIKQELIVARAQREDLKRQLADLDSAAPAPRS